MKRRLIKGDVEMKTKQTIPQEDMSIEDKRLLCGLLGMCFHEYPTFNEKELFRIRMSRKKGIEVCVHCGRERFGYELWKKPIPDFTTGNGFQLISDNIGEREVWGEFYDYLCARDNNPDLPTSGLDFHESTDTAWKARSLAEFMRWRGEQ